MRLCWLPDQTDESLSKEPVLASPPGVGKAWGKFVRIIMMLAALGLFINLASNAVARSNLTDDQVRERLIQDSINSYSGSCPCPYNTMRNGANCGKRSAYSKPGGASPLCYKSDVSNEMVRGWRQRNGQ